MAIDPLLDTLLAPPDPFDVACIGTSISGFKAVTLEAITYMIHADHVYYYSLTESHKAFVAALNPHLTDLNTTVYTDGTPFESAYRDIVSQLLRVARAGVKIAFAHQGSPAFLSFTSVQLFRAARAAGLRAVLVPGVSSFECVLCTLLSEYDIDDVQLYNCTTLASGAATLNPNAPLLLFNVARYASPVISKFTNKMDPSLLQTLSRRLEQYFPAQHLVKIIAIEPLGNISVVEAAVSQLAKLLTTTLPNVTVFIPRLPRPGEH